LWRGIRAAASASRLAMEVSWPWILLYTGIAAIGLVLLAFPFLLGKAKSILHEVDKVCPLLKAADYSKEELPSACPICLCDFEPEDVVRRLPCSHVFHASCIDSWLVKAGNCALCRASPFSQQKQAAEEPQGLTSTDIESGSGLSFAITSRCAEPGIDCEQGQDSCLEPVVDASCGSSECGPSLLGRPRGVAELLQEDSCLEPVVDASCGSSECGPSLLGRPRGVAELLQEVEQNEGSGTIELNGNGQEQLTPMYVPGLQDHCTRLGQFGLQSCETGKHEQELCDSSQPLGYIPLGLESRVQTPLQLTLSL